MPVPVAQNEAPTKHAMSVAEAERQAVDLLGPDPDEEDDDDGALLELEEGAEDSAETGAELAAGKPVEPAAAAAAPAASAAPAGAQPDLPAVDPWADTEDVEYTDEDSGEKFVVRAPKSYAQKVKGGYARRSLMDRKLGAYQRNREWLDPLAEDGRLDKLSPYLQSIFNDKDVQDVVVEAFARRNSGRTMKFADEAQREAAAAGAATAPAPITQADRGANAGFEQELARIQKEKNYDDYTMEVVRESMQPLQAAMNARFEAMQAQYTPYIEAQRSAQAQQQQATQRNQYLQGQLVQSRAELEARWPDLYTGANAAMNLDRVDKYAQRAGLIDRYGVQPLTFVEAHQRMMRDDGATSAPSTAAATVADIDRQARQIANAAAAQTGGVVVNAGASQATPAPKKKIGIPRFVVDKRSGKQRPLSPLEIADFQKRQSA